MQVTWIPGAGFFANSYVFSDVLVDAGVLPMEVEPFKEQVDIIVLTHCHFDHTARLKEIAHMCHAKVAIHRADAPGLVDDIRSLAMNFGGRSPGVAPDIVLEDGDKVGPFSVIHTPGHTPGSISLYNADERVLMSGDTVFTGGAFGRYDFPGGSRRDLEASIKKLSALDVEGLFPGHDEPVGTGGSRHIAAALQMIQGGYG